MPANAAAGGRCAEDQLANLPLFFKSCLEEFATLAEICLTTSFLFADTKLSNSHKINKNNRR
jgi:hypothetical protein